MFRRLDILLILTCLLMTAGLYSYTKNAAVISAEEEFRKLSNEGVQTLRTRLATYLQSLNSTAAFIRSSEEVTMSEFEHFVSQLDIPTFLPGIKGIGQIVPVAEEDLDAFVEANRATRSPDYTVHPDTGLPERMVIQLIAPLSENAAALGLDAGFEADRRAALEAARISGEPQLTSRLLLVQDETKQAGFLLLQPFYERDDPTNLPPADRGFLGWIYAPFVGENLLRELTPQQGRSYHLAVYDGGDVDPSSVIYEGLRQDAVEGRYAITQTERLYGRKWTIRFVSTPEFDRLHGTALPAIVLISGLLLTALLGLYFRSSRLRSETLAELAAVRARQLGAREDENRSIVENAVTAVFILDADERILTVNQAGKACFGYAEDDMKLRRFRDFVDRTSAHELHTHGYNATGRTASGEPLMLDVQTNEWLAANGMRRVTAIVRNVTAEITAQEELEATKRRYDLAIAGARIGIFDLDVDSGTSVVSDVWHEIMGTADIDGPFEPQSHFLDRVHPDDLPMLKESDRRCIEGETDRSTCEFRVRFGEDEWRWMRSDAVAVERGTDGHALRLVGAQTDVTDLRHSRNALKASEERFRLVVQAAPVGMALMNAEGEFLGVNDALCELGGYTTQQLLNEKRLHDLLSIDDIKAMFKTIRKMIESGTPGSYKAEHQIVAKDGSRRWGLFNVSWTYDLNIQVNVFIAQIVDITDQKKLDQIKSEFVSTVSHELRTPLTSIKGALSLLDATSGQKLPGPAKRLVEIAQTNADRLTTIVNDILDLEKISSGEVNFDFDNINLSDVVRSSVKEMSPFAVGHKNTLEADLPDEEVTVYVDGGRTKQVLFNLISNACKYSSEDSPVTVRVEKLEDRAIVFVQNHGPGVPEAFRSRIFQAFSQADGSDTRSKGGTGLGLNITRQIVWRQGGNIGFESVPGGPTVFWFTCPIARADIEQNTRPEPGEVAPGDQRVRVLHIEDDLDFAEVIRAGLGARAEVVNVTSLAAARRVIGRTDLDVVIIDWSLPDGSAEALLDLITEKHPDARVLGLSAASMPAEDDRIDVNLVKSRTEVSEVVDQILGRTSSFVA